MSKKIYQTKSVSETQNIGQELGKSLSGRRVIALYGDLGSGKTSFVQGLALGMGVQERMISPTFVVLRSHKGKSLTLHHIDLYRLSMEKEIIDMGILDLLKEKESVVAIEWAEKLGTLLPKDFIEVRFEYDGESGRKIIINER